MRTVEEVRRCPRPLLSPAARCKRRALSLWLIAINRICHRAEYRDDRGAWEGRYHTRKHAHAVQRKSKYGGVSRAVGLPPLASKYKAPSCCERPVSEEPLFGKLSVHFCSTLALHRFGSRRSPARPRSPSAGIYACRRCQLRVPSASKCWEFNRLSACISHLLLKQQTFTAKYLDVQMNFSESPGAALGIARSKQFSTRIWHGRYTLHRVRWLLPFQPGIQKTASARQSHTSTLLGFHKSVRATV